jgi:hypothetical protein
MAWMMMVRRRGWWLKVLMAGILVAVGDRAFLQSPTNGVMVAVYCGSLLAAVIAARPSLIHHRLALGALAAAVLFCLAIADNGSLLGWSLFWIAAAVMALAPFANHCRDAAQWSWRLVLHAWASLFRPVGDLFRLGRVMKKRGREGPGVAAMVRLLALPVLGTAAFTGLFVLANPVLEGWLASLRLHQLTGIDMVRLGAWPVLAMMAWSLLRPARFKRLQTEAKPGLPIPDLQVETIRLSLIAFNTLFALQNGMDLAFMSGLVALPDDLTLAQYAHRGAYPLVATALLAGLFVLVTMAPGSRSAADRLVRRLVVVWVAQNMLLVASSVVRTLDYVDVYSLTQLRLAALVWMALVGLGLALICVRLLRGLSGSWLINTNATAAGLVLAAFCFVDTAAICADWNTRHAREAGGRGEALDLGYLRRLGPSSLVALTRLEAQPLPPAFKERVHMVRLALRDELDREARLFGHWNTWRNRRIAAQADGIAARLPAMKVAPGARLYDGTLQPVGRPAAD